MNNQNGQSLIELIVAVAIFGAASASLAFFILDSYSAGRLAKEITAADFLAQEGLEAARAIRDNNFSDLASGNHGLQISANRWVFQGTAEDISSELTAGTRQIIVEDISADTKKITSSVNWQFSPGRNEQTQLATYLTNWQRVPGCQGACVSCASFTNRGSCNNQSGCSWNNSLRQCQGACLSCDNFSGKKSCEKQAGCVWQ